MGGMSTRSDPLSEIRQTGAVGIVTALHEILW